MHILIYDYISPGHLRHQLRHCVDDGTTISSTLNAMTLKLKKRRNDVGANTLSQIKFCVIFPLELAKREYIVTKC